MTKRFPHRVQGYPGSGLALAHEDAAPRQFLQGAVDRGACAAEFNGQHFLSGDQCAGCPDPLGDAPGHFRFDGMEGFSRCCRHTRSRTDASRVL